MTKLKVLNAILDFLMFVVPILELSELVAVVPPDWLPWYMLATVILRRFVRMLEDILNAKSGA